MTLPFVTVIMPIRNESDFIARSLGAVLSQDYSHERMEVLVSDGMSKDNTRQLVQQLSEGTDIPIVVIDNIGQIVPTGFNAALKRAQGDIIVRVDGHTIIEPDYVTRCVESLRKSNADNVGGRMKAVGNGAFGAAIALATSSPFGVGGSRFHYSDKEEFVDTVYMGAWWREVFERIGYFDEALVRNQDDEFNYRLRAFGGKILLSPSIKSTYFNRSTIRGLARQYYQYGLYKVRVMQLHPSQMRPRQFAPLLLVSMVLIGGLFSPFYSWIHRFWITTLRVYCTANVVASIWISYKEGWHHIKTLPLIFSVLHFSYGLGFLHGLVKFRNLWSRYYDNIK